MPAHGTKAWEIDAIYHVGHHNAYIFPDDTNKTVTLTAGGVNNVFGAWAAVVDNLAAELSTVFAADPGHICCILIEECSVNDKRYELELSWGAARTFIGKTRFVKKNVLNNIGHVTGITTFGIPAGETIYYRLKCETGGSTTEVHFRYYTV